MSAADTGTAHHKFFQHVTLKNAGELAALADEADRLEREKVLSAEERGVLDLDAVAAFWNSDVGQEIRLQAANVKRELSFTAKFSPAELSEIAGTKSEAGLEKEFVVVQGVADLVVLLPDEIWLVDFKTDAVRVGDLPEKIKTYAPQVRLYASALAKVYSRPVTHCWLHFLAVSENRGYEDLSQSLRMAIPARRERSPPNFTGLAGARFAFSSTKDVRAKIMRACQRA